MASDSRVLIDIWSDYVCPFCYLELPYITRLQHEFGPRLDVVWHAFELRPEPKPTLDPNGEYLHDIWNRSVYPMAAERGMILQLPPVQPRSRKAFEAVFHARSLGRFDDMHLALFRGFFEQAKDIGDMHDLMTIAELAGFDQNALREALESGRYTEAVLDDERHAAELGVSGVPLALVRGVGRPFEESLVLRGAVPYANLHAAVMQVIG